MEPPRNKIPATVSVLTHNSAAGLDRALSSVADFAEIIVMDGGSTDATLEIAHAHGTRMLSQGAAFKDSAGKLIDFAGVRNDCLRAATYPWHLYVDSDEYLSPDVVHEIRDIIENDARGAYWVPRKYVLRGNVIDCSLAYPNQQMRFFHKDAVKGFVKPIHERIELVPGVRPHRLTHAMLVPMEPDMKVQRAKTDRYIDMELARQAPLTFGIVVKLYMNALKSLVRSIFRSVDLVFCKGNRMPFRRDWEPFFYELRLAHRALKLL